MPINEFGLSEAHPLNQPQLPVEQCEVSHFKSLTRYRKKRAEWLR
jgi:hypothetical protein